MTQFLIFLNLHLIGRLLLEVYIGKTYFNNCEHEHYMTQWPLSKTFHRKLVSPRMINEQ